MNYLNKLTLLALSFFAISVIISFISGCKDNPTENQKKLEPIDFLPASHEIEGWTKSLAPDDYIDARDSETLKEIVGDNYEVYVAHHFQKGVKQIYEGKVSDVSEMLELRIFDHLSIDHSQKLFHDKRIAPTNNYVIWPNVGDEARIQENINETTIDFYYDKFFVWISIPRRWEVSGNEAKNIAIIFAINVHDKITRLYRP